MSPTEALWMMVLMAALLGAGVVVVGLLMLRPEQPTIFRDVFHALRQMAHR